MALACGPLRKARYINDKMERELVKFKVEVENRRKKGQIK
jgi:hypothetical protein